MKGFVLKGFIFKGYFPTAFYAFTRLNNSFALETIFTKKLALLCVSPVVGSFCIECWSIQNGTPVPSRSKKNCERLLCNHTSLEGPKKGFEFQ